MKYINVQYDCPFDNFALEEHLLLDAPEDSYLFFYIHKPAIIVGAHQNTIEEINETYVREKEIVVARRMSGGGAVYHDHGNLNFSFVKPGKRNDVNDFEAFTKPIVDVLRSLGVPAELQGRNDLVVEGKKISGNASCYKNGRILAHGTLLFDANMSELAKALQVNEIKLRSKGVQSVRSRVANIADYLSPDVTIEGLKQAIIQYFAENEGVSPYELTEDIERKINYRAQNHFSSWAWNWGASPSYNIHRVEKFPCGIVDVRITKKNDAIESAKIYGDFFTYQSVDDLEKALMKTPWTKKGLADALSAINIESYFTSLNNETFIDFLLDK